MFESRIPGPKVGPGTPPLIDNYFRRHTPKTNLGPFSFFFPDGESVGHPKARGGRVSVPGLVRLVRQTEPKHEHLRNLIRGLAQEILLWGCSLAGSRPRSGVGFAGEERGKENMKSLKWNYKTITVMVYYHVHARRRKCAMIRWTFQCARDVGTRESAASTCPVVTSTCPTTCPTTCP